MNFTNDPSTLQCFIVIDNQCVTLKVHTFNPSAILHFLGKVSSLVGDASTNKISHYYEKIFICLCFFILMPCLFILMPCFYFLMPCFF